MIELVSLFEDSSWTDSKWCNIEHVILAIVVANYFYIALVLIYGWDAPLHCGVEEAGIEWMGAVIGGRKWALSWSLNRPTSPSSFSKDRTSCKNCAAPAERKKQMSTWKVINNCTQKMRDSLRQIAIGKSGQQKQNSFVWILIYIICRHHCRMKKRDSAKGKRCEGQTFLRCMWSPIHPLSHNKGLVMLRNESITNKNLHLYSKIGRDTIVTFNFSQSLKICLPTCTNLISIQLHFAFCVPDLGNFSFPMLMINWHLTDKHALNLVVFFLTFAISRKAKTLNDLKDKQIGYCSNLKIFQKKQE